MILLPHLMVGVLAGSSPATCPNATSGIMIGSGGKGHVAPNQTACCSACYEDVKWLVQS